MVSWGHPRYTGVQHQLRGVTAISANDGAFAALLEDGGVVTWGDPIFKSAEARAYDMFFHCFLLFFTEVRLIIQRCCGLVWCLFQIAKKCCQEDVDVMLYLSRCQLTNCIYQRIAVAQCILAFSCQNSRCGRRYDIE